jgi:hypothetical protein
MRFVVARARIPEQQSADRYECHNWAKQQTGFDPTRSTGGVEPDDSAAKHEQYRRALRACLEGRGQLRGT